ncbi:hypothetical protein shim_15830 [Shimia sp. SK013]|uniref:DUF6678 family protein n=1 Tax=Shimia sp. SK013 TaxID=1389006 RepID=UPI0006CD4C5D|nr:DUF6678 family protein [Shimia sp. SK013]KPA22136.1 hypothetical protein shim_15830 [Shimia sp. SK013]
MPHPNHYSVCNDTKWLELRACMLAVPPALRPSFRSKFLLNGYVSRWDSEWHYHFLEGGFTNVEWFDLKFELSPTEALVNDILAIGLAGFGTEHGVRLLGYAPNGTEARLLDWGDFPPPLASQ